MKNLICIISGEPNSINSEIIGKVLKMKKKFSRQDFFIIGNYKLIKKFKAKHIGFASIIDRSTKKSLKINKQIVSHLKIDVPTYKRNRLPKNLKSIPITTPGSRYLK